jgi:uncharacterized membrane protein YkvA (DUF1232 family)
MAKLNASAWMIVPNLLRTLVRSDVALKSKLILLACVVYLISPVDLLPDVLVGLGWLDDLVIVPLLGWLSYRSLPEKVQADVVPDIENAKQSSKRVYIYIGILIIAMIAILVLGSGDGAGPMQSVPSSTG